MRTLKRRWACVAAVILLALMLQATVYGAQAMDQDNHTDTTDYCMRAYDVTVGLKELSQCVSDKDRENLILQTAAPKFLLRSDWTRLDAGRLHADFTKVTYEANESGYEVRLSAPSVTEGIDSSMSFYVYIKDDLPKTAKIHFEGGYLDDMEIQLTQESQLTLEKLCTPKREGYTFCGWYLDKELKTPALLPEDSQYQTLRIIGDLTLYPKWEKEPEQPQKEGKTSGKKEVSEKAKTSKQRSVSAKAKTSKQKSVLTKVKTEQRRVEESKTQAAKDNWESQAIQSNSDNDATSHSESSTISPFKKHTKSTNRQTTKRRPQYIIWLLILVLLGILGGLIYSICKDIKVLRWYQKQVSRRNVR